MKGIRVREITVTRMPAAAVNSCYVFQWRLFANRCILFVFVGLLRITDVFLRYKVTIDLELHFAKWCQSRPSSVPLAQYDIYLHRVPSTARPRTTTGPQDQTGNGPRRSKPRVLRWEDNLHRLPLFPPSTSRPVSSISLPTSVVSQQWRQQIAQLDTGL